MPTEVQDWERDLSLVKADEDFSIPRWHELVKTQHVRKVNGYFVIPESEYDFLAGESDGKPFRVYQFNYTAPAPFTVINYPFPSTTNKDGNISIRYRIGNTAFRYMLVRGNGGPSTLYIPDYNGEIIKPNFVIEAWSIDTIAAIAIVQDIVILTSLLYTNTEVNNFDNKLVAIPQLKIGLGMLRTAMPEVIPTSYPD